MRAIMAAALMALLAVPATAATWTPQAPDEDVRAFCTETARAGGITRHLKVVSPEMTFEYADPTEEAWIVASCDRGSWTDDEGLVGDAWIGALSSRVETYVDRARRAGVELCTPEQWRVYKLERGCMERYRQARDRLGKP